MSNAKQESEPMELAHGAVLQIGQTKLLCHIHDGHSTCGQCEPGLLADSPSAYTDHVESTNSSKIHNVGDDHKRQLKNLKKRYGLQDESKFDKIMYQIHIIRCILTEYFRILIEN